ncbi:Scytalone dehydratase [Nemania sp. NC0429]|nr:Scytalone dehydratase [Nemania sp. NC0429]
MENIPAPEDVIGCSVALFEWAESFDTKDWNRLGECLAPSLWVDYTSVMGKTWEEMPAHDFVALASSENFLGNPLIKTQHFIGASRWEHISTSHIVGHHQVRVAHQKYTDEACRVVDIKGHAHGGATTQFKKIEGIWKFAGLRPDIRWYEYDYDKVFGHE